MITKEDYVLNNLYAQKAKLEEKLENVSTKGEATAISKEIALVDEQIKNFEKPVKAKKAKK